MCFCSGDFVVVVDCCDDACEIAGRSAVALSCVRTGTEQSDMIKIAAHQETVCMEFNVLPIV
jgi:hypothetical protein